jgi:MFS family permease
MAEQNDLLTKVGRSYVRHRYEDGLDELASGVDLAVMGVALSVMALSLRQQVDYAWFTAAIFLALAVGVSRDRVMERIRQRVTYPRIGYVSAERGEPLSRNRKWLMWLILLPMAVAPVAIAVLLFTDRLPDLRTAAEWGRWAPALYGVLMAAVSWWDADRFGIRRLRLSGVSIGFAGIVASLAASDVVSASGLFCLGWGVIELTTGGITLWRFRSAYDSGTP